MTLDKDFNTKVMLDPKGSEWLKMEQLKQVKLIREQKKASLLEQVTKECRIDHQTNIDAVGGEAYLVEIEANNPFNKKQVFTIAIDDEDYNKKYITQQELVLIDNKHSEWEKWHSMGKCLKPFNWHIVSASNMTVTLDK